MTVSRSETLKGLEAAPRFLAAPANTAFSVMANRIRVNQLNVGWMASDHEREIQAAGGDADWEAKAAASLPFALGVLPLLAR